MLFTHCFLNFIQLALNLASVTSGGAQLENIIKADDVAFTSAAKTGAFKGVVEGLANSDYHGLKSYWSSTDLKYMAENCPQHFHDKYFGPGQDAPRTISESMTLGSLVHCLLLTPEEFNQDFFMIPELNLRTNEGRALKAKLLEDNAGKWPLNEEILAEARSMVAAAKAHPRYSELVEPLRKELAFFWTCPFTGLKFKAKLDAASSKHFIEVKTTNHGSAKPDFWGQHLFKMHYDLSLVHYREGVKQVLGIEIPAIFLVIERPEFVGGKPTIQFYQADPSTMETGHHKWLDAITKLASGIQVNNWPSYFADQMDIPLIGPPPWAINKTIPKPANEF